ncbi:23972_t:CDS:2, partial [Entrophospora sp. SA101]
TPRIHDNPNRGIGSDYAFMYTGGMLKMADLQKVYEKGTDIYL